MELSGVNSNGERDGRATTNPPPTPTPAARARASAYQQTQLQLSQLGDIAEKQILSQVLGDDRTLESSFGRLSVDDSTLRQQNPLLENPWTYRSSPSSSLSLQNQGINGGGDVGGGDRYMHHYYLSQKHYLNGGSYYADAGPSSVMSNNGGFMNGDVSYLSRVRHSDSYNGFVSGSINNGFLYSYDPYHSQEEAGTVSIASLAKEQEGSVKLKNKIDVGYKGTIDLIFNELIFEICDLMVAPYAFQVVEKLMKKCSSEQITQIIDVITQNHFRFAVICMDHLGTRSIQSLLKCLNTEEQILRLVGAISRGTLAFSRNNNAKHLILRCFSLFNPSQNRVLLEVLAANCYQIAIDHQGCCMLQQCLNTACQVVKQRLIREIISIALELCVNNYGNYLVQYVVELKDRNVTFALIRRLLGSYAYLSRNKYGSHAVQKFLFNPHIDPSLIVYDLLRDIDTLLLDPFGNYVIQTAWCVCNDELRFHLWWHIERNKPLMRCNMFGNKVLAKLFL